MKTPQEIIDIIHEDAPSVYHILHEIHISSPTALEDKDIESYYSHHPHLTPTPEQLLTILTQYNSDKTLNREL